MYRRNALMPRAKMTMVLVTLWGWSTWPISMGWTPTTVPGFSYLTLTVNGSGSTTAAVLIISLMTILTYAAFSSSRRCRWLARYQDNWVSVLVVGFTAIVLTWTLPDIITSEQGSALFKGSVDLGSSQIKLECREQVNEDPLYLPYTAPTSPLHLPYISPVSPLHLPYPYP